MDRAPRLRARWRARPGETPPCMSRRAGLSWRHALFAVTVSIALPAEAFVVGITPAKKTIFLQVGTGSFSGALTAGGTPLDNPTVNVVSVTVPSAALLSGADQQMTSNSAQAISFYDGRIFCSPPDQVYIGGFFRRQGKAPQPAVLSVTVPPALVSAAGDTIPFSQIRWTSSTIGNAGAQSIPDGTFVAGGTQFLADLSRNTWRESCLTFFYANEPAAAGTYEGRVTYTLTVP